MLVWAALGSALVSGLLILALRPLLLRYALARPNARSSHKIPTPQGGGIAVLAAALGVAGAVLVLQTAPPGPWSTIAAATVLLALVGAIDDIRPLPALPRLGMQIVAVAMVVVAADIRILPDVLPAWAERLLLVLAGTWFVNLANFMDGLDWITVAEMVPVTATIAFLGWLGLVPPAPAVTAAALCGALVGFAPFNRPVARLFLGDVGSLPIGLLVGWMLLELAGAGGLVAALLLPLYYLMDATLTLLRRLARRERVWEAHRSHFYQQATTNGLSAMAVSVRVFAVNVVLAALAGAALAADAWPVRALCLGVGIALVSGLLFHFARPRVTPVS